jgi:hypothetical protein
MTSSVEYFYELCKISFQPKRSIQEHNAGKIHRRLLSTLLNGLKNDEFSALWQGLKNKTQQRKKQLKKVAQLVGGELVDQLLGK